MVSRSTDITDLIVTRAVSASAEHLFIFTVDYSLLTQLNNNIMTFIYTLSHK